MSISKSASYHHGNLRQALIDAAVGALQTEGIEALSLRKLAKDIGVSHNAPYMHFEDKEALLAAIAEEGFKRLAARGCERVLLYPCLLYTSPSPRD